MKKIVWFASVAIIKIGTVRGADKKVTILTFFAPNQGKNFISSWKTILSLQLFRLHFNVKIWNGNKVACDRVAQCRSQADVVMSSGRCLKKHSLTNELNIIYEDYCYSDTDL